ncbi:MAG: hypothetical protein GY869_29300 [Planctomycetes bacterium]|nr:hypothetical protein [Planctomycetota bacterium]
MSRFLCLLVAGLVLAAIWVPAVEAQETREKNFIWSSVDVQLYGYFKLDAAYDTHRTSTGNFARWVESDMNARHDDQFNMTANQTRFGLKLTGPKEGNVYTSGQIEIDLYGNGAAENKPGILLRHAYLKFYCVENDITLLAGQTSDVISPLVPSTVNYIVAWWGGNIGYRRPQIRLTKGFELSEDTSLEVAGAITRTIGDTTSDFDPGDAGEDSGIGTFQARVGLTLPLLGERKTVFGVSGHWGQEEYDIDQFDHYEKFDSWSINVDLVQPINDWLTLKGEAFTGENLQTYFGGIGQGINVPLDDEIGSTGGWVAATLTPVNNWIFNIGATMEDVRANDVEIGDRTLNNSIFANATYSLSSNSQIALELSKWHTERRQEGGADSIRTQLAFIFKF